MIFKQMKIQIGILLVVGALSLSACKDEGKGGTFVVDVSFAGEKPTAPCWILAEVRKIQSEGDAMLVTQLPPKEYLPEGYVDTETTVDIGSDTDTSRMDTESAQDGIVFPYLPHGDDYVVMVKVIDSLEPNARTLYMGSSSRFSLKADTQSNLSIVLSTPLLFVQSDVPGLTVAYDKDVDLLFNLDAQMFAGFEPETWIQVSNTPDFEEGEIRMLSELIPEATGYTWPDWDLNDGVCEPGSCEDGDRVVYAHLINPAFGTSDISYQHPVWLDTAAPKLQGAPPDLPELSRQLVSAQVRFTEPVKVDSVVVDCDGMGNGNVAVAGDTSTLLKAEVADLFEIQCVPDSGHQETAHTISVSATDASGRPSGKIILDTLVVDTELPAIDGQISFSPAAVKDGDSLLVDFWVTEAINEVTLTLGGFDISSSCAMTPLDYLHYTCLYRVSSADVDEGKLALSLSMTDTAENIKTLTSFGTVAADFTTPTFAFRDVTPPVVGVGDVIETTAIFSEVPESVFFDFDGINGFEVGPLEDKPNHYVGNYTVQAGDENKVYEFGVSYYDAAGNGVSDAFFGEVMIDTVMPEVVSDVVVDKASVGLDDPFTFQFTVSEPLQDISVVVGIVTLNVDQVCSVANDGVTYSCIHSIGEAESEGIKDILILMEDYAGNQNDALKKDAIICNHTGPSAVDFNITPRRAKAGDTVYVTASFSEPVGRIEMDWDGLSQENVSNMPDENSFVSSMILEVKIDENTPNGEYNVVLLSGEDIYGLPLKNERNKSFSVDTVSPSVVDDALEVSNTLLKDGDSFRVDFDVSEYLKDLKVYVGWTEIDGSFSNNCYRNQCSFTHQVRAASELSGRKSITIEMTDEAGNHTTKVFEGELEYDFSPPGLSMLTEVKPEEAMDGDVVTLKLVFSDAVKASSIVMDWDGLDFELEGDDGTTFTAEFEVDESVPQGIYYMRVLSVEDEVGNVTTQPLDLPPVVIVRRIHVSADAPFGGNGLSWNTAFNNLQVALDEAISGQEIWVKQGVYHLEDIGPAEGNPEENTFALNKKLTVYGGFDGSETSLDERVVNFESDYSVLDGQLSSASSTPENAYHVVTVSGIVTLDGFVIQNGKAVGSIPDNVGGGVLVEKGQLTLANCLIKDNNAQTSGGGMYSYMSSLSLDNVVFVDNRSELDGGALYVSDSVLDMLSCQFNGNSSKQDGGGLLVSKGRMDLFNTEFVGNGSDSGYGGAIRSQNTDLTMFNNVLMGNSAKFGGALSDRNSLVEVGFNTLFSNTASVSGQGIYLEDNEASQIDIHNNILWDTGAVCQVDTNRIDDALTLTYSNMSSCADAAVNGRVLCSIGCLSIDPAFEDATGATGPSGLMLSVSSPCIDNGLCSDLPLDSNDIDGDSDASEPLPDKNMNARCAGGALADMGAFEVQ